MIVALAAVVRAYTRDAARTKKLVQEGGELFDEDVHPLDGSESWKLVPRVSTVENFLRTVVVALELDESSVVIGLILLDIHSVQTWPPAE